jgi:hypothetical protein
MWNSQIETLENGRVVRCVLLSDDRPLAYAEVIELWRHDADFRSFFIALLAGASYSAFRWETPPITVATVSRPFEFVMLDSPGLARAPDVDAFADYFKTAQSDVLTFSNIGKDAILVVPCPVEAPAAYGHLAAFLRSGSQSQVHNLLAATGEAMVRRVSSKPVWLSTAGAGVSWLHVRLDDRPKYYVYELYRRNPA